jgi:putative transposase
MVPVSDNQAPKLETALDGVIALDPGVRTFMTGCDASGNYFDWCSGDQERLCRLKYHAEKLRARIRNDATINHRQRYRMRKASSRAEQRIHHLVDEVHRKLIKWLCENYRVIFMPKFEISTMVRGRKISKKTKRGLYAWRFYDFRQRLLAKAAEYPWVQVFIVNEAYTTKTCTHCGWLHEQLKGNKIFNCGRCHQSTSRDQGGARNILLRQLRVLLS